MGDANALTTEAVYSHVYEKADHANEMSKLGALSRPAARQGNVRLGSGWVPALACSDSESADRRSLAVGTLYKRKRIDV
jgi:hypothetical protein